jgi:hypothetical protein
MAIDSPRVMVGQKTTLLVTVLAPNYMPSPPVLPDFQVRNAVTRPLGAVNQTETRDGMTFAGVRYEFAIYPQEPGNYVLAEQQVKVTYAVDPPKSREVTVTLPRQTFEAFIPDAAQDLDPFISAQSITLEQKIDRSSQDLKVGSSISRTVIVRATGTPAMLLPPAIFAKVDGLALYPGQPSVQDSVDRRSGVLSATRVDEATYMLEKAGDYRLPAIELAWWNVRDSRIERARADAILLHVAENPAEHTGAPDQGSARVWGWHKPILWILDHWRLSLATLLALAVLARFAPPAVGEIRRRLAARRSAYLASEAWSFAQFRDAIRSRDPQKAYFALLDWLNRFAPAHTIEALRRSARDPLLDHELSAIESSLFGRQNATSAAWSPRRLLKRVSAARRRLRQRDAAIEVTVLPPELNPSGQQRYSGFTHRPVAR